MGFFATSRTSRKPRQRNRKNAICEEAIFKLDYRPTRDSIEAGKQLPNFDGRLATHITAGRFKKVMDTNTDIETQTY